MEEHAPTTLPGDTPFILCEKTGKLGRSVPGGAEYEQDQAQELGFGLLDSDVESSPEEKRSRDIYMRQTRKTTEDVEPDPKQGTSMEADAEKVPVVPSPAPVHEQRGGERQSAFDAPMSEYSPEQRKEPYAFGHLEIEFDWPEDESPEQERRLNEAVKHIMRYINRSDSNKMGEDMIDSEERAMERRLLTNRSARRLRDLTDHMERHLHRIHMERGARERVTKQLIDELQMEDGCEGWKDWRTTSRELSRYNTANRICLLYTSPSPRDGLLSRMPSSA